MEHREQIEFRISPDACIIAALALLLLPLRWIVSAAAAAVIHECCHYLALRTCGVRIYGFSIGAKGAQIATEPMGERQELICALAGPLGSLSLLFLIRWMPLLAVCAAVQGIYNLLPVLPFDGGRAVDSFLSMVCPGAKDHIMKWLRRCTAAAAAALGGYAFWGLKLGYGVLAVTFLLVLKTLGRKIPCKAAHKRVQ